jgi:hypothetical protein
MAPRVQHAFRVESLFKFVHPIPDVVHPPFQLVHSLPDFVHVPSQFVDCPVVLRDHVNQLGQVILDA